MEFLLEHLPEGDIESQHDVFIVFFQEIRTLRLRDGLFFTTWYHSIVFKAISFWLA